MRTGQFVADWQNAAGGRIRTLMAPHAPYTCDDDFLRAAAAHAKRLNVGVHIHAAEDLTQTQSSLARRGITPIQVLEQTGVLDVPTLIAHGCGILPEDIELLRNYAERVGVAHCPKTYLKLAAGLTPIRPLQDVGVAIGLGSDADAALMSEIASSTGGSYYYTSTGGGLSAHYNSIFAQMRSDGMITKVNGTLASGEQTKQRIRIDDYTQAGGGATFILS